MCQNIEEPEEKKQTGIRRKAVSTLIFLLYPALAFYLMEAYEHNPFQEVRPEAQLFNLFLFLLIAGLFYFLTGRMYVAVRIEIILAVIFGITNHYVMKFRSTPFVPWDLFSVKTAAGVAGNYNFMPDIRMVLVTIAFLALYILAFVIKKGEIRIPLLPRLGITVLVAAVLCLFTGLLQKEEFQRKHALYPFLFTPAYMTDVNGMAVTFAMNLAYVVVEKPKGYQAQEVKAVLESMESPKREETQDLPNIIVIMNESFSDLSVLGNLQTNEDYMPFMHKMQKGDSNTVTGYAQVSVCGGNTANSEFEFLTGDTMAFLPSGSIPYQQYIKKETPSLASWLKSLGYATYAQHPYYADGWDRERVYPLLGFDHMSFLPQYGSCEYVRKYVSDASDIQKVIETYEHKEKGKPAFIFNVTIQNHGGYRQTYANFQNEVSSQYADPQLDQYLSLVRKSDDALSGLVDYFSGVDEKTVVVFFGDHQPNDSVANVIRQGTGTGEEKAGDYEKKRYLVPYMIWANYPIKGQTDCNTSLNYLAAQTLERAGVPTSAYQNYLLGLNQVYPVISAAGKTEGIGASEETLNTYRKMQYYQLFEGDK